MDNASLDEETRTKQEKASKMFENPENNIWEDQVLGVLQL